MTKNKGYTLLELMIIVLMIGIVSALAISPLLGDIPAHKAKNGIIITEQAVKTAKSIAAKTSSKITVDFALAVNNVGNKGGQITIKNSSGGIIKTFEMEKDVLFNTASSTIANNKIIFDFRGQPVDNTGDPEGFDDTNNTVAVSYYANSGAVATESFKINPLSGTVDYD